MCGTAAIVRGRLGPWRVVAVVKTLALASWLGSACGYVAQHLNHESSQRSAEGRVGSEGEGWGGVGVCVGCRVCGGGCVVGFVGL